VVLARATLLLVLPKAVEVSQKVTVKTITVTITMMINFFNCAALSLLYIECRGGGSRLNHRVQMWHHIVINNGNDALTGQRGDGEKGVF
jgi:hypothetical protein